MRFRAKRRRKYYKSDATYLKAVFNKNQKKLIEQISPEWLIKRVESKRENEGFSKFFKEKIKNYSKNTRLNLDDIEMVREAYLNKDSDISPELKKEFKKVVYDAFKTLVKGQMQYENYRTGKKYTIDEALDVESRSKDFNKEWTTGDVYARNFHKLVTRDKNIKELFYQHEVIRKINYSEYNFLGYYLYKGKEVAVYNYGDSYFIDYQSPKDGTGSSLEYVSGYNWQRYLDTGTASLYKYRKRK